MSCMPNRHLPDSDQINKVFDTLDLIVVRVTLLALIVLGAYALLRHHI